jgi:DNA-binding NtrC family response regulator
MISLERYNWPGNVRELQNLMRRLAVFSSGIIGLGNLPEEILSTSPVAWTESDVVPDGEFLTLEQLESKYVFRVLSAVGVTNLVQLAYWE